MKFLSECFTWGFWAFSEDFWRSVKTPQRLSESHSNFFQSISKTFQRLPQISAKSEKKVRSDSSSKYTLVSIYSLNGLYKDLKLGRLYCSNQFFVWPATCINAFFSVDSTSSSKLSMNLDYIPHLRKVLTRPLMTQVHGSCVMLSCVNDIYDHVLMLHTDMCNVRITWILQWYKNTDLFENWNLSISA